MNIEYQIDFKYSAQFNEGMLQLQEMGVLAGLQKKWWKERKGGGACSVGLFLSIMFHFLSLSKYFNLNTQQKNLIKGCN